MFAVMHCLRSIDDGKRTLLTTVVVRNIAFCDWNAVFCPFLTTIFATEAIANCDWLGKDRYICDWLATSTRESCS